MIVGRIPSLTWNSLKMNSGVVSAAPDIDYAVYLDAQALPEGVSVSHLSAEEAAAWLDANTPAQEQEYVVAGKTPIYRFQRFGTGLGQEYDDFICSAAGGDAELIEIGEGATVKAPVVVKMDLESGKGAAARRIIHVGSGSSVSVVLRYRSEKDAQGSACISTKIVLDKDAQIHISRVQMLGSGFLCMDDLGISLDERAKAKVSRLDLGAGKVYVGLQAQMCGKDSQFLSEAAYYAGSGQLLDMNYNVVQRGKRSECHMTFEGVLENGGSKCLRDTIDFRRGAAGAVGDEQENVLLLTDDVQNRSLPIILCEEENMEGRHGATIGRLDEDMLFYMASRGIDTQEAQQIMVRAKLESVSRHIPDLAVRAEIQNYIEAL